MDREKREDSRGVVDGARVVGLESLADADYLYIRLRVFQGWLRGLTSEDG